MVLEKLVNAGLKIDLKKSDFAVKELKYLGFVVTAGKGISVDPEKKKTNRKMGIPKNLNSSSSLFRGC